MTGNADQAARMRAMWSAVVLTSLNDAISHTATESKKHKGRALKTLTLWANSRDGRDVLSLAGIDPDKCTTDCMLAFAAKGVPIGIRAKSYEVASMSTKNYSKASKRRSKQAAMPGLAETPKRKSRGATRMREIKADPEAERTVLEARARQCGMKPKDMTEMRRAAYGEPAGQAIYATHQGDTAKALWDTYAACSAAYRRYLSICMGASVDAKTAKIEMMPERFEVDASHTPDNRDEAERHRAAENAWDAWRRALYRIDAGHTASIYSAMHGSGALMDAGQITAQGKRFVKAMVALAKDA